MKTYLKQLILLITVIFLTSCASGLKYDEFITTIPDLNPDTGRIYFYRIEPIPLLYQPVVKLNGEKIGYAVPLGFFYVDRPAGSYEIEVDGKLSLFLEGNQTRYVRLKHGLGFLTDRFIPELVEESEGLTNIEALNYSQGPGYCKSECNSDYDSCIESIESAHVELSEELSKEKECEDRKNTCDNKCSD